MSRPHYQGVWRFPAEETKNLYPNGCVHDGRGFGSLMVGGVAPWWIAGDTDWDVSDYTDDPKLEKEIRTFVFHLLSLRGEYARLLLVLANAERTSTNTGGRGWWKSGRQRTAVRSALKRCLDVLDEVDE